MGPVFINSLPKKTRLEATGILALAVSLATEAKRNSFIRGAVIVVSGGQISVALNGRVTLFYTS